MASKSAQQKAQDALDVAERRVKKLEAKQDSLLVQSHVVGKELDAAIQHRDYAAKHPDLANNGIIELPEKPDAESKSFESSHKDKP